MPSKSQIDDAEHDEITLMNHTAPGKRSSLQHQTSGLSNEKVSLLGGNRRMRSQEKGLPLKSGKATERTDPDQHAARAGKIDVGNSVPRLSLGNRHKPWPSRKVSGVEEVVKYMSSVPSYLQRLEKGVNVQEKALNFGVLDWGRLEEWTYLHKQMADSGGDSPSRINASTFRSSSESGKNVDSPLAQWKQSCKLDPHQNSSVKGSRTKMMDQQSSARTMGNLVWRTSCGNTSVVHSNEKSKLNYSNMNGIFHDNSQPPDSGSSPSTSKDNDTSVLAHNNVKTQIGRAREAEKAHICEHQSFPDGLHLAENWLHDQCLVIEGVWDHLQDSVHERRISYDSTTVDNGRTVEVKRKIKWNSFSGNFPSSDSWFPNPPPQVPYSCPLPSISQSDEPVVGSTSLCENEVLTANAKGKYLKPSQFTDKLSEQFVVNMADESGPAEVKEGTAPRRELSPLRLFSAGLSRLRSSTLREGLVGKQMKQSICSDNSHEDNTASNSRRRRSSSPHSLVSAGLNWIKKSNLSEGSSGKQMKQTICSDNSHEDNAASDSRSRRSPLQRIFDPLLKSKNHIHFSEPITSLPSHRDKEVSNTDKLPICDELKFVTGPCKLSVTSINPSSSQVTEAGCSVQADRQVTSTRQALLKLAWKNGLPLFVLSSNDSNILVATMGKRSIEQKHDFECVYTIFIAHELKRKGRLWMSQRNKSRKHDLVYNVVGQMRISSKSTSCDSNYYSFVREFVLFGSELTPTTPKCVGSLFNSELAAIVIKVRNEKPESNVLEGNCTDSLQATSAEDKCSTGSLQIEQKNENSGPHSIVAILPSGVHGLSSTGEPSPLIKRWKSGGSCDCGGWDEGCVLTVLTDKIQGSRSSISDQACTADGTHRIELFTQGEARKNKHAFSMIACKEGLYTIDFDASITLLQAFAICIAILHSRKPTTFSGLQYSMEAQSLQEHAFPDYTSITTTKQRGRDLTSYVPVHPPLSPVERA